MAALQGVLIAQTEEEAVQAVNELMVDQAFGQAGKQIVIEEFMTGPEVSVLALQMDML